MLKDVRMFPNMTTYGIIHRSRMEYVVLILHDTEQTYSHDLVLFCGSYNSNQVNSYTFCKSHYITMWIVSWSQSYSYLNCICWPSYINEICVCCNYISIYKWIHVQLLLKLLFYRAKSEIAGCGLADV